MLTSAHHVAITHRVPDKYHLDAHFVQLREDPIPGMLSRGSQRSVSESTGYRPGEAHVQDPVQCNVRCSGSDGCGHRHHAVIA